MRVWVGQVIHADLIPTLVGLRIFQAMPNSIRFKALLAACRGQGDFVPTGTFMVYCMVIHSSYLQGQWLV
jgi:hypothetical protein